VGGLFGPATGLDTHRTPDWYMAKASVKVSCARAPRWWAADISGGGEASPRDRRPRSAQDCSRAIAK